MNDYWLKRTKARLDKAESVGLDAMKKMLPVYDQALKNIEADIKSLYKNYASDKGVSADELRKILSGKEQEDFIMDIHRRIAEAGYSVFDVYDEKYIGRITRLEALKQQIFWEIQQIAPKEQAISEEAYKQIIEESYQASMYDVRQNIDDTYSGFSTIDPLIKEEILRGNWKGSNYSKRIWNNVNMLNQGIQEAIPRIIGGGALVGSTYSKVSRQIREEFDVGRYNSMRLVRTETNYFQNLAELQSYKDEKVGFYEYIAILDNRTSDICERLDGETFKVVDAEVGFNYPPMHPNCRSSTKVIFDNEAKKKKVWSREEWEDYVDDTKREELLKKKGIGETD